jgi:hypothetical protein
MIGAKLSFIRVGFKDGKVCIAHKLHEKLELIWDNESILPLLGFKEDVYRGQESYLALGTFIEDPQENVYISFPGSSIESIELVLGQETRIGRSLRSSRMGFFLRQMPLRLYNVLRQTYDFLEPFWIRFHVVYLKRV